MKMVKRFISLLLAVVIMAGCIPSIAKSEPQYEIIWTDEAEKPEKIHEDTEDSSVIPDLISICSLGAYYASVEFTTLSGKIIDEDANGVSGVSVLIYNIDENEVLSLCESNSNGNWTSVEYDILAGYTYVIRYYKPGYEFSYNDFTVVAASGGTLETMHSADVRDLRK